MSLKETQEELKELYHKRIRRVKRWLRPLPRRATVHRYPFLRRFAKAARKRSYLWSFRQENVIPALYAGFIITFLPIVGIQIPIATACAFLLRGNLPILVGLQLISNPITIAPIYGMDYYVGNFLLTHLQELFTIEPSMQDLPAEEAAGILKRIGRGTAAMMLGGAVMGYIFAVISCFLYRRFASHYKSLHSKMAQNQKAGEQNKYKQQEGRSAKPMNSNDNENAKNNETSP